MMTELEALKWDDWERNTIYNDGKSIGLQEGKKKKTDEMLKNMLELHFSINDIEKVTKQSIDYINQIKEER